MTYGAGAWHEVQAKMRGIVLETLVATKHTLHKLALGFEWLGFDMMVTEPSGVGEDQGECRPKLKI